MIVDFTKVVLSGLGSQGLLGSHRFSVILGKKKMFQRFKVPVKRGQAKTQLGGSNKINAKTFPLRQMEWRMFAMINTKQDQRR